MSNSTKNKTILFIQAFSLLALAASCSLFYPRVPRGTPPMEAFGAKAQMIEYNVPYIPGKDKRRLRLDVYSNPHEGLQPMVIAIHGGAWILGAKNTTNIVFTSKALTAKGYVVFDINHRLAPMHEMREQVEDAMAAVIWAKEHAADYGADPERVGIVGDSAGGHIAALIAWASDDPYFTPTGNPQSKYDSDVKAAALFYPVIDLDETLRKKTSVAVPAVRLYLTGLTGKKYKRALEHLSPINHIDSSIPPTMFLVGDKDGFKLYPQLQRVEAKLEGLGVDTALYTARGRRHGFMWKYWWPESEEAMAEAVAFLDKYLK